MYAVIFRAEIAQLDAEYLATAARMRELAMERYGCRDFTACTEGNREIAISYWDSEEQILAWKRDREHLAAQKKGRTSWYASYTVEVARIERAHSS
jgi:heme-degrading monooxygenase HmoA